MIVVEPTECFTAIQLSHLCRFQDAVTGGIIMFVLGILVGVTLYYLSEKRDDASD